MGDAVVLRGVVATTPRHVVPERGAPITSFRLVTDGRHADRPAGRGLRDGGSNWYIVTATHELAVSAAACVALGDPLLVSGRLCVREWEGDPPGATVEIEAQAMGHDLACGRSVFTRSVVEWPLPAGIRLRGDPTGAEP